MGPVPFDTSCFYPPINRPIYRLVGPLLYILSVFTAIWRINVIINSHGKEIKETVNQSEHELLVSTIVYLIVLTAVASSAHLHNNSIEKTDHNKRRRQRRSDFILANKAVARAFPRLGSFVHSVINFATNR